MRTITAVLGLAAILLQPAGARAQASTPAGVTNTAPASRPGATERFLVRSAVGYLGLVSTGIAFGFIGASIENAHSPCYCDDPGLAGFILGFSAGALLGAPTVAAIPSWKSECSYGTRWTRAMAGSLIALLPGALYAYLTGDAAAIIVTPIAVSPIASAIGLRRC